MKFKLPLLIIFLFSLLIIPNINSVEAKDWLYFERINYPLLEDYNLEPVDNNDISLKLFSNSTNKSLILKMMTIVQKNEIGNYFTLPEGKTPADDLYFMSFDPVADDSFTKQPQFTIKYELDGFYKEVYFFDWTILEFVKLDSIRDELNKTLTVELPRRKKIMIVVLNEPEIIGRASWYVHQKYEGELIAASRDLAKETKVRVYNLYNNKEVIVTIKDFGPKKCIDWTEKEQRQSGPCQERVIDLSKTAFLQLATTTGVGIISQVKITPIN